MDTPQKMNPEVKAKWIEALRSGNYQQGRKHLRSLDDKFCCLGVIEDVMGCTWEETTRNYEIKGFTGVLPPGDREKFGLDPSAESLLISMNDSGKSFAEIAAWIEEHL